MKNFKKGFTLAEVLITLAIIGVVAAMTIPALINRISNDKYISGLKKAYSTLSQATQMIIAENGGSFKSSCTSSNEMRDLYNKYIKATKNCDNGSYAGICWHENSGTHLSYYLSGNTYTWSTTGYAASITTDGSLILYAYYSKDCTSDLTFALKNTIGCGRITVDVNGFNPPNMLGRDIFYFAILENRLVPMGTSLDSATCTNTSGVGCAGKVLNEGGMNY